MDNEFGIYYNIIETDETVSEKDYHRLYQATCSICGAVVKRRLYDLKHFNKVCTHQKNSIVYKIEGTKNSQNISLNNDYNLRVYEVWRHMLYRTTEKFQEKYPTYKGTTVCHEWYDFSQFYNDIKDLLGYELWANNPNKRIMLDKDLLGNRQKIYSKETCCFLTPTESNHEIADRCEDLHYSPKCIETRLKIKQNKGRKVKIINTETKEEKTFLSIKECARFLETSPGNVYMCLSKDEKYKSMKVLKGWQIQELNNNEN